MVRNIILVLILSVYGLVEVKGQTSPFELKLEEISVTGLGGLQAYAYGQDSGKWVLFGGRLDGLHRRQPFASFDIAGNNNQIIVVDVIGNKVWKSSLNGLSTALQEQLSSTNMEFHQEGHFLYIIGGYGYNASTSSRKTFGSIIAVDLEMLVDSIVRGGAITGAFRQIMDQKFAVTGGHLDMIGDVYYLIGGNKFDGNYNPMGNPTYVQVYTNSIRKFKIEDDGMNLNITHLSEVVDTACFHRRDYNTAAQILPNRNEGITVFSGVFRLNIDLPFLNCVNIDSQSHKIQPGFQQFYNHYHCPVLPVYSYKQNQMNTVFFGGIAQFYDSAGTLVQDDNVPFVKTIARVVRNSDGTMAEYKMPVEMPELLGSSAEFIRNEALDWYENGVLKLDSIQSDSVLVGYIFGGISSTGKNIFFTNTGTQSAASSQIFKVYLYKSNGSGIDQLNTQSNSSFKLEVYPNPNSGVFQLVFYSENEESIEINLYDVQGRLVYFNKFEDIKKGSNNLELNLGEVKYGGTYFVELKTSTGKLYRKLVLER